MPSRETTTAQTYRIRPATMADCSAIRRIRNAAVRESLAIWTSIEQNSVEAKTWLAPMVQRGTALVAHVSGRPQDVVGFAVAGPWHSYEGYARTVENSIYLSPSAQGKGLGARLLAALIEASRRAGDRTMIVLIEAGNATSVRLHERYGFTTVGTVPQAGEKHGQILDLTLMSRRLKGLTMCCHQNKPADRESPRWVNADQSIELQPEEPAVTRWQVWGAWCFSDWGSFSSRESIGWRPCQQRDTQTSSRSRSCEKSSRRNAPSPRSPRRMTLSPRR